MHQIAVFLLFYAVTNGLGGSQARNQLGTPRGAKNFLRGAQSFYTMSNRFELCPKHSSRGGGEFSGGASPPWLRAWWERL